MSKEYYSILEINRDSSEAEIAKAYRKLSLRFHPKLCKDKGQSETYHYHFCQISEAYEVLSDPVKRAFYDKYGEEKLKEGFFSQGNLKGGYRFSGNPEEVFERFFGSSNPFAQIYDSEGKEAYGSLFGYAFGGQNFHGLKEPNVLSVIVECTINELYNGCSKQIEYERTVLNQDGRTTTQRKETKLIEIKRGFKNGQQLVFNNLGNEASGMKTSDLIFKIQEKPHNDFKRKDNDLIYIAKINLIDALSSTPIQLITLDGRKLFVPMDEIICPKSVRKVQGEGMPIYDPDEFTVNNFKKAVKHGDLYIKFDISFPLQIAEENRQKIKELLTDSFV